MKPSLFDVFKDREVDSGWEVPAVMTTENIAQRIVCGKEGGSPFIVVSNKGEYSLAGTVRKQIFSTMGGVVKTAFMIKNQSSEALAAMLEKADSRMNTGFIDPRPDQEVLSASMVDFEMPPVAFFFLWEKNPRENECQASAIMVATNLMPFVQSYLDEHMGNPEWFSANPAKNLH